MNDRNGPLFVARADYRRRRLVDAIKLVPVLGTLLFLIPVLNMSEGTGTTLSGSLYLFSAWLCLIAISAFLANRVTRAAPKPPEPNEETQTDPGNVPDKNFEKGRG